MRILVLGKGLVGSAITNRLSQEEMLQVFSINRKECDLREFADIENLLADKKPDVVIFAAGIVGGIEKNLNDPTSLILENSKIILNVIESSFKLKIPKLINIVPACVYPGGLKHRMVPSDLFSAPMENSSLAYSMSKLNGLIMVSTIKEQYNLDWISIIPTNVYGTDSKIESNKAHVIPALISKLLSAKELNQRELELLGDGRPVREFLHVTDLSAAVLKIIQTNDLRASIMNIAGSDEITIRSLAETIRNLVGYRGKLIFNSSEKNGASSKLLDGTPIQKLGWNKKIKLEKGLSQILNQLR